MPNKTIYVSDRDVSLFEEAQEIAGEALSAVIVRALREFIAQHGRRDKGMREISVFVGHIRSKREKRFIGRKIGDWQGADDEKEWWLEARIFETQKGNIAIWLRRICKAALLARPGQRHHHRFPHMSDFLEDGQSAELVVGANLQELREKVPSSLYKLTGELLDKLVSPVEYLDI